MNFQTTSQRMPCPGKLLVVAQVFLSVFTNVTTLPITPAVENEIEGHSVSVTESEQESDVRLAWLNQTTMQIVWPDKTADIIHLEASKNLDGNIQTGDMKRRPGNGIEGTMVCTSLGSLLRPLFYFLDDVSYPQSVFLDIRAA